MLGSILKYAAVALGGAIVFSTAGHFMDCDVIDAARESCDNYAKSNSDLPTNEFKEKMKAYILINRDSWVSQLVYASSVKDLDDALATWA